MARAARWRTSPPAAPTLLSREDQYIAEALWHIQRRNEAGGIDPTAAVHEDAILETFFAPVLDTPLYGAARWTPEQRADLQRRVPIDAPPYVSAANPLPIYVWSRMTFWLVTILLMVAVWLLLSWRGGRASTSSTRISTT